MAAENWVNLTTTDTCFYNGAHSQGLWAQFPTKNNEPGTLQTPDSQFMKAIKWITIIVKNTAFKSIKIKNGNFRKQLIKMYNERKNWDLLKII